MADSDPNTSTSLGTKIEFIQYHRPVLMPGKYEFSVAQSIAVKNQPLAGSPFTTTKSVVVQPSRFELRPDDVYKVFPADCSHGDHSNVLPHIVLSRSTLPWERQAGETPGVPWLLLLLFEESEKPAPEVVTLKQLGDHSGYPAKFPSFKLESGQKDDDKVTVIDVQASVLEEIMPAESDLSYLAHVRMGTDAAGNLSGDELAVVIGNRLPVKDGISTVHLVSVEGRFQAGQFDTLGATNDELVRLVSLKSWSFACLDEKQNFKGLLTQINHSPGTLRLPANQSNGAQESEKYLSAGFVPLPHSLRTGEKTVSFYHGPLLPAENSTDVSLPASTADNLVRYDPSIGLFDVSYAAAWELGRLLSLQSKKFSVGLYNWKRAHAQRLKQAEQILLHPHLPAQSQSIQLGSSEFPEELSSWLSDLSLLKGVPFGYLVPDETMFPKESIRFFWIDRLWIECLLDGAFSIGRVTTSDHEQDKRVSATQAANAPQQITGILLRSDVVSGWPGLLVDARDSAGNKLDSLRVDRLSTNTLICLFEGELNTIEIHLKPEDLHFGLDAPDPEHPAFHKKLRDNWGKENTTVIQNIPWQQDSWRVLKIGELADEIKSASSQSVFTSAQFALEMIEGVDRVIFSGGR